MTTFAQPYGTHGYIVPPERNNTAPAPALGSQHQWVCTAIFTVPQHVVDTTAACWAAGLKPAEGIELDHENLASVIGPVCLKCHVQLSPQTHAQPCPVHVVPVLGIVAR